MVKHKCQFVYEMSVPSASKKSVHDEILNVGIEDLLRIHKYDNLYFCGKGGANAAG